MRGSRVGTKLAVFVWITGAVDVGALGPAEQVVGTLRAALAWASRGFRIFPLQPGGKRPIAEGWTSSATSDPETIQKLWTYVDPILGASIEKDYNIGFLTTGWIVPDVDTKHGKTGLETFARLGLEFDTLTTRTPSGGYHLIYRGDAGQSPLGGPGSGIDIRSRNGYIVAPGSMINGVPYAVELDLPVADFPERLRAILKAPRDRMRPAINLELDTAESVELATYYLLRDAPHAIEGQNGDDATFRVACRVRDLAISEQTCFDLMLDFWNARCEPPWPPQELLHKVQNAYRYAAGAAGSAAPVGAFQGVEGPAPPQINGRAYLNGHAGPYAFGKLLDVEVILARPWIVKDLMLIGVVTMLIAAGGAGKSTLILTIAAHLAVGRDFLGFKVLKAGKSIIYNAEDDLQEASRRLNAICIAYGLDREVVRAKVALVSSDELALCLTEGRPPKISEGPVAQLIAAASDPEVVMVSIDPLIEVHSANENDNVEMKYVMGVLRLVAQAAQVAILGAQHTGKPPPAASTAWVGSQFAGRGASSVPAGARVVLTLFPASERDIDELGVSPKDRGKYVRLDGAKANLSKALDAPRWLRWESLRLSNGDNVGVLLEHVSSEKNRSAVMETAEALVQEMRTRGSASLSIGEAETVMRRVGSVLPVEDRQAARRRLGQWFSAPCSTKDGAIRLHEGNTIVMV